VKDSSFDIYYEAPNGVYNLQDGWAPYAVLLTNCTNITLSGYYEINNVDHLATAVGVSNCWSTDLRNIIIGGARTNGIYISNIDSAKNQRVTLSHSTINAKFGEYSNAAVYVHSTATGIVISDTSSVKINSTRPYKSDGNLTFYMVDLTANETSGGAPLAIQFYDNSTSLDQIIAWNWTFGDNSQASVERNPMHVYNTPGTYTVTLTIFNTHGESATRQYHNLITVTNSTTPLTFNMSLVDGWNLVTIPLMPENSSINAIFPTNVIDGIIDIWGWDEVQQNWVYYSPDPGDYFYKYYPALTNLVPGKAYWIELNKSLSFTLSGNVPDDGLRSPAVTVSGWNFIGLAGLSESTPDAMYPDVLDIWGWDAVRQNWVYYSPDPDDYLYQYYPKIDKILSGQGFWVEKG
jgi:PKD repeat protein